MYKNSKIKGQLKSAASEGTCHNGKSAYVKVARYIGDMRGGTVSCNGKGIFDKYKARYHKGKKAVGYKGGGYKRGGYKGVRKEKAILVQGRRKLAENKVSKAYVG